MALSSRSEQGLTCVLCDEVFSEPVSAPCGHSFCQSCISVHWRGPGPYKCPTCGESYPTRPKLQVNAPIHSMVQRLGNHSGSEYSLNGTTAESVYSLNRTTAESMYSWNGSTAESVYSLDTNWSDYGPSRSQVQPRLVWCDFCSEPKSLAVKFCQDCSSSFCDLHLQPHHEIQRLRKHLLLKPGDHQDQVRTTSRLDHKPDKPALRPERGPEDLHSGRLPSAAYTLSSRKVQLRVGKIQELEASLEQRQREADLRAAEVVKVFNAVVQDVQTSLDRFTQILEETQARTQDQAQSMIQELEHEIHELSDRDGREKLIFLHSHSLKSVSLKDWDGVCLAPPLLEQGVAEVVADLENRVSARLRSLRLNSNLQRLQSHAVRLTLDPRTAHRRLQLSQDDTAVQHSKEKRTKRSPNLRSNPERFTQNCNVMTRQSFTTGRHYFEVQVSGKSDWDVGVARRSVNRKKKVPLCPENGFWVVSLRDGERYQVFEAPPVALTPSRPPQRLGVFVDCEGGVVSFYDADTGAELHSFNDCTFRGPILPILNPCLSSGGRNTAPLVLTPVQGLSQTLTRGLTQTGPETQRPPVELSDPVYYSFG